MKWSKEDIEYLLSNYSKNDNDELSLFLKRDKRAIGKKARRLGLKKEYLIWDENDLNIIVKESHSFAEVLRKKNKSASGDSYKILKKYINLFKIDTSHFNTSRERTKNAINKNTFKLEDILIENSTYTHNSNLKKRLIDSGLLEYKCKKCGLKDEWCDEKLVLQLDHINGINNDNRIENLRLLCPNCHSQTKTFGGKNIKNMIGSSNG